jgi:alpha-tubulin suppressor-like RCC1 family protein
LHIAGHGWTGAFGTGAQTILSYETSHVSPQDRENNFRLINDEANIDSIFSSSSSSSSSSNDSYDTIINVAAGWGHTAIVCKNNNNNDTKLFVAGRPFDFQALLRLNRLPSFVRRGALSLSMKLDEENYWDKQGKKLISNFYNNNNNNNNSSSKEEYHHSVMSSFREVKLPNNDQPMSMIDTSSNNHHHHHTLAASAGLTAIIGKSGKAYTFGLNRSGQCGVGNKDAVHIWNPTPLDFASTEIIHHISLNDDKDDYKDDKIITDVALGLQHGLVLDDKGLIYAFGKAARGQLGIADDDMTEQNIDHEYSPVQIRHFRMDSADSLDGDTTSSKMSESDVQVNRISAGWNHCAVVTDNNHAWIWGKNVLIDDNKTIDSAIPVRINGIPDELAIIDISCGSHHTSILMEDGSVYATGIATDANVPVGGGSVLQIVPPGIIDMPVTQFKSHFDRTTIIAGDNGEQILEVQLWSTDELRQQAVFEPAWVETMFGDCSKIEQVHRGWKHTVILGQK